MRVFRDLLGAYHGQTSPYTFPPRRYVTMRESFIKLLSLQFYKDSYYFLLFFNYGRYLIVDVHTLRAMRRVMTPYYPYITLFFITSSSRNIVRAHIVRIYSIAFWLDDVLHALINFQSSFDISLTLIQFSCLHMSTHLHFPYSSPFFLSAAISLIRV